MIRAEAGTSDDLAAALRRAREAEQERDRYVVAYEAQLPVKLIFGEDIDTMRERARMTRDFIDSSPKGSYRPATGASALKSARLAR